MKENGTLEQKMQNAVLCLLVRRGEVCLAMKKRGFGMGKWNGYGGKVQDGESLREAAAREVREESGVAIDPRDLIPCGDIEFYFRDHPEFNQCVYLFTAARWTGEPQETEEMKPQWFPIGELPFHAMWIGDVTWMPRVLRGKRVSGEFHYDESGEKIISQRLEEC